MATAKCYSCGDELLVLSRREARCRNADCPAGGRFVRCGFCDEHSFSVYPAGALRCINPECRMHDVVRTVCPSCRKASRIAWKGIEFCMNRHCSENRGVTERCFFCGHMSLFRREDRLFCTKGGCPQLLEELRVCETCGKASFVIDLSRCENPVCEDSRR